MTARGMVHALLTMILGALFVSAARPLAPIGGMAHRLDRMLDYAALENIVREAGQMALSHWPGHGHAPQVWEKTPGSPVCEADIAVDAFLKRELGALLPSAGWLSEETVDHPERLERGLCWLVDPVDGTRDFIRGRPGCCAP